MPPLAEDLVERAGSIAAASPRTYGYLALRRDKQLLFSRSGNAFLMDGRCGQSWIAKGDPIGPPGEAVELVHVFRELVRTAKGWCVFFEIAPENSGLNTDVGLELTILGEEARVDLDTFSIEGHPHRKLRQACSKLRSRGYSFGVLDRSAVAGVLETLKEVSDAWLGSKRAAEKGFSNASFDRRSHRHGGQFYDFEGLRYFKEKFSPVWSPRYLASPGGLALGPILLDVSSLMAGSLRGIFSKHQVARTR